MPVLLIVARTGAGAGSLADAMTATFERAHLDDLRCAPAGFDLDPQEQPAALLDTDTVATASLVVATDRRLRARAARLHPPVRTRLFTLVQAAELADRVASTVAAGRLPQGAPPLPESPYGRLAWFTTELDAARGQLAGWPKESLDLPDDASRKAQERARAEAERLAAALAAVASGSPA